ncbi:hypothetical protein X275_00275 [Marinitoga sp. 1197]|uniref:transposase n=1 Tax=Marinitoga sp. 1197 TaxID=1428449 RepID=UPI0006413054|nr:transposase [Marinitoga sp. 1197]KLO24473.1 hypothetical protein X275_00275 [Marinitoga sp. 1197]
MIIVDKIKDDKKAEEFLMEIGVLKLKKECPYCGCKEIYSIRRNHFKCKSCRREWSKYNESIFKDIRIKPLKFIKIIHELAKGKMLKRISEDLKVSYNTVLKIRKLLLKRFIKKIFGIDKVKEKFSIGIRFKNNDIELKYIEELYIEELENITNEKLGRLYIFKNIHGYDLYIVFSEKVIKSLEKKSKKINLKEARKELHNYIKHFSEKILRGKISNRHTLLFTLAQSYVIQTSGSENLFLIFMELLKSNEEIPE